jgi:WD40 repeat protein
VATAGEGPAIRLWDVRTGKVSATFVHPPHAAVLAFSPDGRWLASGGPGSALRFWGLAKRAEERPLPAPPRDVRVLAFSPDGSVLAAGQGATVTFWGPATGQALGSLREKAEVVRLAWSPSGRVLATECRDGALHIRHGGAGRWSAPEVHAPGPGFLGLVGEGALARVGGPACLYDTAARADRAFFSHFLIGGACAPGGTSLALVERGGAILLWAPAQRRAVLVEGQRLAPVDALAFLPGGAGLVTGGREPPRALTVLHHYSLFGRRARLVLQRLETGPCPELRFWCPATGAERPPLPGQDTLGATHVAVSADGRTLVSAGKGGAVWVWDAAERRLARRLFVNDAARHFWGVWELGRLTVGMSPLFKEEARAVAVSPDGTMVATASGRGEVSVWERRTGGRLLSLPLHHDVRCLAFSPDGRTLAVNHGDQVRLWTVPEQAGGEARLTRTLPGHAGGTRCLAFDPTGRFLASGGADRRVVLWGLKKDDHKDLIGHTGTIRALAFTPDGRTLASGAEDARTKLWHVQTASELLTLEGHQGPVRAVAFSPDGTCLASGGASLEGVGEAFLWHAGK